ncbi:hypothetical protein, partial [Paraprevotella xylaniphila]|uniref:hypothetical protein n=1 Tax=Paraprevotella xylaniphila TaxID=454155 RepID=UPI003FD8C251
VIPCVQGKERKEQSGPQEREEYGIAAFHVGLIYTKLRKEMGWDAFLMKICSFIFYMSIPR